MAMDTAGVMDSAGKFLAPMGNFAGGTLSDGVRGLLQVRRGRLKVTYDNALTQYVLQFDAIPTGLSLKDAYLLVREPWLKSVGLKAGVFDRPFGFEISYSSSSRESPERSRLFQTLFPGERDLGAALEVNPAENFGWWNNLNLKGGLFNGTGGTANENDDKKDFIGRLGFALPFNNVNLAVDGGVSTYMGTVRNSDTSWAGKRYDTTFTVKDTGGALRYTRTIDSSRTTGSGDRGFAFEIADGKFRKSAIGQYNQDFERNYLGFDLQLYYDTPIGGLSLRGEYIGGVQPGTATSGALYNPGRNSNQAVYAREFAGFYVMYVQNLGLKNQLALKYDAYDPNTGVEGSEVMNTASTKLSPADLAYTTIGIGWVHHWDENVKFVVYYDKVTNENAAFGPSDPKASLVYNDDLNDDVLTVRVQYKF
jgi:hypothetical protein